jgi:hypothetical protein
VIGANENTVSESRINIRLLIRSLEPSDLKITIVLHAAALHCRPRGERSILLGEVKRMSVQTVTMQFDPATAATLRMLMEKAQQSGQTLNALLQTLTEGEQERQMTAAERANDLVQWLKAHSVKGIVADDSRESIYTREDEAF